MGALLTFGFICVIGLVSFAIYEHGRYILKDIIQTVKWNLEKF